MVAQVHTDATALAVVNVLEAAAYDEPTAVLAAGVPIAALTVGLVQLAKETGLDSRYAGGLAILLAAGLAAVADAAAPGGPVGDWADYILAGVVYGLAAAGAYSQAAKLGAREAASDG